MIHKVIAGRKERNPNYDESVVWHRQKITKHIRDGTPQLITLGCTTPDIPCFPAHGGPATTIHAAIKAAGPRPLTLLNIGSWT